MSKKKLILRFIILYAILGVGLISCGSKEQLSSVDSEKESKTKASQEPKSAFFDSSVTAFTRKEENISIDADVVILDAVKENTVYCASGEPLPLSEMSEEIKNDLLPPPTKKKYSREHMLVLTFIYYFKNLLSITDIQALLKPLTDKYFKKSGDFGIEDIYKEVFSLEKDELAKLRKDIEEKSAISKETFKDAPEEDRDFLQLFSFICLLAFDTYMKKTLIEKLIDSLDS